eukprot:TRINITY_DN81453_c0_g1_i1.p1 TRINITY_DN81453_c0_g1~~TRINITY_DN81453_c0_g1_i1.p1  ORF type:complete len:251 (+),score=44.54 TRINITY_DN81453_c0_g1_i1:78-830(+)
MAVPDLKEHMALDDKTTDWASLVGLSFDTDERQHKDNFTVAGSEHYRVVEMRSQRCYILEAVSSGAQFKLEIKSKYAGMEIIDWMVAAPWDAEANAKEDQEKQERKDEKEEKRLARIADAGLWKMPETGDGKDVYLSISKGNPHLVPRDEQLQPQLQALANSRKGRISEDTPSCVEFSQSDVDMCEVARKWAADKCGLLKVEDITVIGSYSAEQVPSQSGKEVFGFHAWLLGGEARETAIMKTEVTKGMS